MMQIQKRFRFSLIMTKQKKNKDDHEAKEFYFLGEIFAEGDPNPIHMESTNDDAFEILYRLDVPVRSDIYDYIVT